MPSSLLPRGVYQVPALSLDGNMLLAAVNYEHRIVRRVEVLPGENPYTILAEMWDYLDSVDPEHSRRAAARDVA